MTRLFSLVCAALFFFWLIIYGLSSFSISSFDGALRLLPHFYIAQGFIPYKDFAIVYPPGLYILVGQLTPFFSVFSRNLFFALLVFAILVLTFQMVKHDVSFSAPLFLLGTLILLQFPGDPFSLPLLFLLSAVHRAYLQKPLPRYLRAMFGIAFAAVWFRWDWVIFYVLVQIGVLGVLFVQRDLSRKHWKPLAALTGGIALGLISMFVYFYVQGTWKIAYEFIVTIPAQVILPYRKLPLPKFAHPYGLNLSLYVSFAVFAFLCALAWKTRKKKLQYGDVVTLAFPLVFLPYSLGRADWPHALPLTIATAYSALLVRSLLTTRRQWISLLLFTLAVVPIVKLAIPKTFTITPNRVMQEALADLSDCSQAIVNVSADSIFVGRISYNTFLWNAASLYLLRPTLKPATMFINDDPGLQNSRAYGQRIADQLRQARKPMLAFLEEGNQPTEENMTKTMSSCGKIESYLNSASYDTIGKCFAYKNSYVIRVYR